MATSKSGQGVKSASSTRIKKVVPETILFEKEEAPAPQKVVVKMEEGSTKPFVLQVNGLTVARFRTKEDVRRNMQRFK